MRYIVLNNINNDEIAERVKYIKNVFNIYAIPFKRKNYVEFISLPSNIIDIAIFIGHNNKVYDYVKNNYPKEHIIVFITCYIGAITTLNLSDKIIYISNNRNGITELYDGSQWNINFKITNSELTLYNLKKYTVYEKLEKAFERLK